MDTNSREDRKKNLTADLRRFTQMDFAKILLLDKHPSRLPEFALPCLRLICGLSFFVFVRVHSRPFAVDVRSSLPRPENPRKNISKPSSRTPKLILRE